jgi:hypothetical protein
VEGSVGLAETVGEEHLGEQADVVPAFIENILGVGIELQVAVAEYGGGELHLEVPFHQVNLEIRMGTITVKGQAYVIYFSLKGIPGYYQGTLIPESRLSIG